MHADRLQQYVRSVVEREREPVVAGAYVLYVHPTSKHPYLNYAIPIDVRADDGTELIAAATARGLVPRLEYVGECFPGTEAALARAGFAREGDYRMMTCTPDLVSATADVGIDLVRLDSRSGYVEQTLTMVCAAFGEPPPSPQDVGAWSGNTLIALHANEVVGCASWTTIIDGMTEIGGVAVADHARRRGIGTSITAAATRAAFAHGASLAFLTPGDDGSARVYARAGFQDLTTMIYLRRAAQP